MRRAILAALCVVLLPVAATAASHNLIANLNGANVPGGGDADGQGFASVTIDGTTVSYAIVVSGVDTITAAHIHQGAAGTTGSVVVNFNATFVNGSASGSVTASQATVDAILANPAGYYVNVHTQAFPNGAVRGQLGAGASEETVLYFPVAAAIAGVGGSNFRTDGRMVNLSGETADVTLEYYPERTNNAGGPADTYDTTIAPGEELLLDDFVFDQFGVTDGKGAVRVRSDRAITAFAYTYDDQTDESKGTLGQFVQALPIEAAYGSGVIPFLQDSAAYRSNVGWFNPNGETVSITFYAWDAADGSMIASATKNVTAYWMEQRLADSAQLFGSAVANAGEFYVTWSADEPVFVYGTRNDNTSQDGIHIPGQP